jgi:hypothetical protein
MGSFAVSSAMLVVKAAAESVARCGAAAEGDREKVASGGTWLYLALELRLAQGLVGQPLAAGCPIDTPDRS